MTERIDSGRPPAPHYCTVKPRTDGYREGCPEWPRCVFVEHVAEALATVDDDDDWSNVGRDLATLAGWAVGAVLVIAVVLLLLPVLSS